MTKKIKDLAVKVGTYESEGKTKNKYLNIGVVLENTDGGKFMLLERTFNPAGVPNPEGKSTVLISMFDVDKKPDTHKGFDKQGDISNPVSDDEIPF
jgi:hypothetical protein